MQSTIGCMKFGEDILSKCIVRGFCNLTAQLKGLHVLWQYGALHHQKDWNISLNPRRHGKDENQFQLRADCKFDGRGSFGCSDS